MENKKIMMTRRYAIKTVALATVAAASARRVFSQTSDFEYRGLAQGSIPFVLPPLPYPFDALEPHIDARMIEIHHGYDFATEDLNKLRQHDFRPPAKIYYDGVHASYVKNLNKAIGQQTSFYVAWSAKRGNEKLETATNRWLEGMLRDLNSVPEEIRSAIRNHGGGHSNHTLFWQTMKKDGGGEPKGVLAKAIEKNFGSFADFKAKFSEAAAKLFGSGWTWLTLDIEKLQIETTPNEDTPLSLGRQPLLGLDVWEHAYYLKYQNRRADYIAAWWNVVNWDFVAERYAKFKA